MSTFRLAFDEDGLGARKFVEFESEQPTSVFTHMQTERHGRKALLSIDGDALANITLCNKGGDFWVIGARPHTGGDASES